MNRLNRVPQRMIGFYLVRTPEILGRIRTILETVRTINRLRIEALHFIIPVYYILAPIRSWLFHFFLETLTAVSSFHIMKNKIGFNLVFAFLAFPIGLALFREFDFQSFTFRKTALGFIYLITFTATIYLMLKKNKKTSER